MAQLEVTIQVNGNPLRRAYVEHLVFGVVQQTYLTDDDGRVRDIDGTPGIASLTPNADIRILCQNSVVRVVDGDRANIAVSQQKSIRDGSTVNLNRNSEQDDHYAILNRCLLTYDIVFRQFKPFASMRRPDFPLGRRRTLSATKDASKRIEVSFPSRFPGNGMSFVEPHSASTGFPLFHVRERRGPLADGRLFGEDVGDGSGRKRPTLIPAELAHALHFSLFTDAERNRIQTDYLGWLILDGAGGGTATHSPGTRTSPMISYIEALDLFSTRFAEFVRMRLQGNRSTLLRPMTMTTQYRRDFLDDELSGNPRIGNEPIGPIATLDAARNIVPNPQLIGRADDEGAIYGCIFLDFARRAGLRTAVNAYLMSAADNGALTFGQYKTWIRDRQPRRLAALEAAQRTWGL